MIDASLLEDAVGYVSFEWDQAPGGVIDARAGGMALIGFDESIRFFNRKQRPGLSAAVYEIPVRTGEGSWFLALLGILALPGGAFAMGYAKKAGERMAERDFGELGFVDLARKSADALERFFELGKHTGKSVGWDSGSMRWEENATIVGVENEQGEVLYFPAEYMRWYLDMPRSTISKLMEPVRPGRRMVVAAREERGGFRTTIISEHDRAVIDPDSDGDDGDFVFPDLHHGDVVVLDGVITRGNQETNTFGFSYKDHILNCYPEFGSVRRHKQAMFLTCRIKATVIRHVRSAVQLDRKPSLLVSEIEVLERDNQQDLFEWVQ